MADPYFSDVASDTAGCSSPVAEGRIEIVIHPEVRLIAIDLDRP